MASLNDLVEIIAERTGIPKSTVFAYARFAREEGHIAQTGRGRPTVMSFTDAANLLLAVGGTDVTRDGGKTIKRLRGLRGRFAFPGIRTAIDEVNARNVIRSTSQNAGGVDLAGYLDNLLTSISDPNFATYVRTAAYLELQPEEKDELARLVDRGGNFVGGLTGVSRWHALQNLRTPMGQLGAVGDLTITFDRYLSRVTVAFDRFRLLQWQRLAEVVFEDSSSQPEGRPNFQVTATIRHPVLLGLARAVASGREDA